MATENNECAVCCEAFNKSTQMRIACEHNGVCAFEACKKCVRTYLLGTTSDPNCMQCNKAWSDKFLVKNLKASFLRTEYSSHRKELLVQGQLSRMSETMPAVEKFKRIAATEAQLKEFKSQCDEANKQVIITQNEYRYCQRTSVIGEPLTKAVEAFKKAGETRAILWSNCRKLKRHLYLLKNGGEIIGEDKKEEARKFIMACTKTDCRGYLSTQYKCELCEHYTCSKCFEQIGLVKEESSHTCKPENIESAEFIRKQSKPCPCCGTRISKIDGCDQMWCTQCHKAFSWNTGKLVTGTVHNPHFYQYQREMGGGAAPRNPGDVVCGGLCDIWILSQTLRTSLALSKMNGLMKEETEKLIELVLTVHRFQRHFTGVYIDPLRRKIREDEDYEKERIQYILQEISREGLANKIFRKDNARKKHVAVLHVCELFTTVAIDMFGMIITSKKKGSDYAEELQRHLSEYDNLRKYCNGQFKEIGMTYGVCVPEISEKWTEDTSKFNSKGEIDSYIKNRDGKREEKLQERKMQIEEEHKLEVQRILAQQEKRRQDLLQQQQQQQQQQQEKV